MTVQDTRAVDALASLDLAPEQSDVPAASRRPVRRLPVHKDWPTWALVTVQVGILVGALSLWEIGARAGWIDAFFWSQPSAIASTPTSALTADFIAIKERCLDLLSVNAAAPSPMNQAA